MRNVLDISHVIYKHPDLALSERFLVDFGMVVADRTDTALYMRGQCSNQYICVVEQGDKPGFIGFAIATAEQADLNYFASIQGASGIHPIESIGGGERVILSDPNGFRVDMVHGIEQVEELPSRDPWEWNYGSLKRRLGRPTDVPKAPCPVLRLGHISIDVRDFEESYNWYQSHMGLLPTDLVYYGHPSLKVGGFLRCNQGEAWVDHHSLGLLQGARSRVHHTGFEVQDLDAVRMGHDWLMSQGWPPAWGIGRHLLGSQLFDYWHNPFGSLIEHFTDGDVFDSTAEPELHYGTHDILYKWGPEIPEAFLG